MNSTDSMVTRRRAIRGMATLGVLGAVLGGAAGAVVGTRWPLGPNWVYRDFTFDTTQQSPFVSAYEGTVQLDRQVDEKGIVLTMHDGHRVVHPVESCWYMLPQLHNYEMDGDKKRLDSVLANTENLLGIAEEHIVPSVSDGGPGDPSLWFPYNFEHTPGGLENGAPWYSGMAQGMVLSHFIRLHEVTSEQRWLDIAKTVFNSFRHYRNGRSVNSNPWFVSYVDRDDRRFTAFEEYPSRNPGQLSSVVNGNIYAMWGVFDYVRITDDEFAKTLLARALASLIDSFELYRVYDGPSLYGQTPWSYITWKNPSSYHEGVATIMDRTASFCGDSELRHQAEILRADYSRS